MAFTKVSRGPDFETSSGNCSTYLIEPSDPAKGGVDMPPMPAVILGCHPAKPCNLVKPHVANSTATYCNFEPLVILAYPCQVNAAPMMYGIAPYFCWFWARPSVVRTQWHSRQGLLSILVGHAHAVGLWLSQEKRLKIWQLQFYIAFTSIKRYKKQLSDCKLEGCPDDHC